MPAVQLYLACSTQWRVGMSGRTGLDYTACRPEAAAWLDRWNREAVPAVASMELIELMDDLRTVELALLGCDAERRDAAAAVTGAH